MLKELAFATAMVLAGAAWADSPTDDNNGTGNDPQTTQGKKSGPGVGNGSPGGSGSGQSMLEEGWFVVAGGNGTQDPPGTPSGPQGPGQHGSPGPNGNSGP